MVAIAMWLIWLLYEWLLYMCLCLAVWWLVLYAYVSMLVCGVVRVCVLCHVLVVYSLSVLEWLGCLSYAVAGGLRPCLWFALVSIPSYLCAHLIVGMLCC